MTAPARTDSPATWSVADLEADRSWVFALDAGARARMHAAVRAARVPEKPLFEYRREDFDLGPAWSVIAAALREAHHGRGLALVRGLPREDLSEPEFELMNWAIGLHAGVPRPQGKATQYISAVRDVGTNYRSATGRGYSSNASLDFHVDGADLATLTCYNKARRGGQSLITSAIAAHDRLAEEHPESCELLYGDFCFSRQGEEAPDEAPFYAQPIFAHLEGRLFAKWNRNRVQSAQQLPGVPPLSAPEREAMHRLDAILRRPDLVYTMYLEPGDLQIMNNHVILHSRTDFTDHEQPERKRLLCRLWLAPPDSVRLPDSWGHFYRRVEPGSVRGGILGHHHDEACRAFERRQAIAHGMRY
jgi:hypothetical protein